VGGQNVGVEGEGKRGNSNVDNGTGGGGCLVVRERTYGVKGRTPAPWIMCLGRHSRNARVTIWGTTNI